MVQGAENEKIKFTEDNRKILMETEITGKPSRMCVGIMGLPNRFITNGNKI